MSDMFGVEFNKQDLEDIEDWIRLYDQNLARLVEGKHRQAAISMVAMSKRLCPVDTGALRRSIDWHDERVSERIFVVSIFATMPYAPYIEYGTRKIRPFYFMRQAIDKFFPDIGRECLAEA